MRLVERKKILTKPEMVEYINDLVSKYDIKSVEDPFDEQDWEFMERSHSP